MDETDRRILRTLQKNADLSIADLAAEIGLSHTPCWRRVKRLQDEGIILGRVTLLDQRKLGFSVDVFASLRIKEHDERTLDAFENAVREHPEIVECFSMSGESDYVMRLIVRDIDEYEKFLKRVLLHLPGVASVNSRFALKKVKLTTSVPL